MEKINIAKLLKDCPKGMELDCTMWDNVTFEGIEDVGYINILIKIPEGIVKLSNEGCFTHNCNSAKCVIFPKGKTTWEGFVPPSQFKDGDILTNERGSICIYKGTMYYNQNLADFYCGYRVSDHAFIFKKFKDEHFGDVNKMRIASEIEKQHFFQIVLDNGYHWNSETKTLEKLIEPKFKIDDKIKHIKTGNIYEIIKILSNCYIADYFGSDITILFNKQDEYELVPVEPKFKVGDRIKSVMSSSYYTVVDIKNNNYFIKSDTEKYHYQVSFENEINYKLAPNKFDIATLKPFDKVLVRLDNANQWYATLFSHIDERQESFCRRYVTVSGKSYTQIIPYKGNEHLCGTKNNCDEYFKIWEH